MQPCKITVASVLFRHDLMLSDTVNENILNFNLFVNEIAHTVKGVSLLDLAGYPRRVFERLGTGIHFNHLGKNLISTNILQIVFPKAYKSPLEKDFLFVTTTSTQKSEGKTQGLLQVQPTLLHEPLPITVVEGNIKNYIDKFCSEKSIAFSHCISRDFEEEKAMSAGVATAFKRQLGKPNTADCLNKHLAIQKHDRATIYSLLTKPTFNSRPSIF